MKQGKFPIRLEGLQLRRARLESRKFVFGGYKTLAVISLVSWVCFSGAYLYLTNARSTEDILAILLAVPLALASINVIIYLAHKVRLALLRNMLRHKSRWRKFID